MDYNITKNNEILAPLAALASFFKVLKIFCVCEGDSIVAPFFQ